MGMRAQELSKSELRRYRQLLRHPEKGAELFAVEGARLVLELLRHGGRRGYEVVEVLIDPTFGKRALGDTLVRVAAEASVPVKVVKRRALHAISDTTTPQGVLAVVKKPADAHLALERILRRRGVVVFLNAVQDPGNCGTLIRSAAALGASGVVLGGETASLYNPKVLRATAGAFVHVDVARVEDDTEAVRSFADAGFCVVATTSNPDADPIFELEPSEKTLLVVGNEASGISPEVLRLARRVVRIPIRPEVESLNAAVAGAIALYELLIRRV